MIANATVDGELISGNVAVSLASTVFIGGLHTVPMAISWSLRHLATHPEIRAELVANPGLAESAAEEMLRLYAMALPKRRVTRDLTFQGVDMRAGNRVLVSTPSAGRDPDTFADPRHAHLDRPDNPHMAFGLGAHRCVGLHLARPELQIALRQWHQRIPDYTLEADADLGFQGGVPSLSRLPLKWSPEARR